MGIKREIIEAKQPQGFKFKAISGVLENLHDAGCAQDRGGNLAVRTVLRNLDVVAPHLFGYP